MYVWTYKSECDTYEKKIIAQLIFQPLWSDLNIIFSNIEYQKDKLFKRALSPVNVLLQIYWYICIMMNDQHHIKQ